MTDTDAAVCTHAGFEVTHHADHSLDRGFVALPGGGHAQPRPFTAVVGEDDAFDLRAPEVDTDAHESLRSCWKELERLCGLEIARDLP